MSSFDVSIFKMRHRNVAVAAPEMRTPADKFSPYKRSGGFASSLKASFTS
jgi:hypothetical protein